jgi:hypothetical protein
MLVPIIKATTEVAPRSVQSHLPEAVAALLVEREMLTVAMAVVVVAGLWAAVLLAQQD